MQKHHSKHFGLISAIWLLIMGYFVFWHHLALSSDRDALEQPASSLSTIILIAAVYVGYWLKQRD